VEIELTTGNFNLDLISLQSTKKKGGGQGEYRGFRREISVVSSSTVAKGE